MSSTQDQRIKDLEQRQAQAKASYERARAEGHAGACEHYKNQLGELAADLVRARSH